MGRKLLDLTGQRYERLVVLRYLGRVHHSSSWLCQCDCGATIEVASVALKSGQSKSCGCYRRDRMTMLTYKHGGRGGKNRRGTVAIDEYKLWERMRERCYDSTKLQYKWYGARGIKVCDRWLANFGDFLADVGPRPSKKHSLDRLNGNGDYEPGNVRWATPQEQARNRSNNRIVEFGGARMTLVEAAERAGIGYGTVKKRLKRGWSEHDTLTRPLVIDRTDARRTAR